MTTTTGEIVTNSYGYKQYIDVLDEHCCPMCELSYTNTGGGLICSECAEQYESAAPPVVPPQYVLLITYPHCTVPVLANTGDKYVACTEENLPSMVNIAQRLLDEHIIDNAQLFKAAGPVMERP